MREIFADYTSLFSKIKTFSDTQLDNDLNKGWTKTSDHPHSPSLTSTYPHPPTHKRCPVTPIYTKNCSTHSHPPSRSHRKCPPNSQQPIINVHPPPSTQNKFPLTHITHPSIKTSKKYTSTHPCVPHPPNKKLLSPPPSSHSLTQNISLPNSAHL